MYTTARLAGSAIALLILSLTACADSSTSASSEGTPSASSTATPALTVTDPWCKASAMEGEMAGMTGCFGTLTNAGSAPVQVTGGTSTAAMMVQLHETVMTDGAMSMREKAGGFTVPADGVFELAPGANHVMLMELTGPLTVGDQVSVTLSTDQGEVPVSFSVREFSGGNESYSPESSMSPMPSHS